MPDIAAGGREQPFRAEPGGLLVVYFGYTNCPDVCPTTLADLRAALDRIIERGYRDVVRDRYPDAESMFSWWDYRRGDFHQGRGMRIDLVLATAPAAERVEFAVIDRNARKGKQPSDHAPVIVDFA